jgi:hypothetical protein
MAKNNGGFSTETQAAELSISKGPVCLVCGQQPEYREDGSGWKCSKQPGKHKMAQRTFYDLGGAHIQNLRDRRMWAPTVWLVPAEEIPSNNGKMISRPGLVAQFEQGGTLTTDDPEMQYHLDRVGAISGDAGLKRWREVYLTPEQRLNVAKDELADIERKIQSGNSLLAAEQAKRGANV